MMPVTEKKFELGLAIGIATPVRTAFYAAVGIATCWALTPATAIVAPFLAGGEALREKWDEAKQLSRVAATGAAITGTAVAVAYLTEDPDKYLTTQYIIGGIAGALHGLSESVKDVKKQLASLRDVQSGNPPSPDSPPPPAPSVG